MVKRLSNLSRREICSLISLLIILILLCFTLPFYYYSSNKTVTPPSCQTKVFLSLIRNAFQEFHNDNGYWPTDKIHKGETTYSSRAINKIVLRRLTGDNSTGKKYLTYDHRIYSKSPGSFKEHNFFADEWGKPLVFYLDKDNPSAMPRIYSMGHNGINDSANEGSLSENDDIFLDWSGKDILGTH